MKDEDILKIAVQCNPELVRNTYYLDLLNFGAAIAAAEREACAKVCDGIEYDYYRDNKCATAIRMRSNAIELRGGASAPSSD